MRYSTHVSMPRGRGLGALAGALALLLFFIGPAVAQVISIGPAPGDIPILQGGVGALGGVPLFQPFGEGFTEVSATSSNSGVVQVNQVEKPRGGGVSFAVQGQGLGIVTITWRNPVKNEVRQGYYVVASGVIVDRAESMTLTPGQVMLIDAVSPVSANAYVGNTSFPSNAVVTPVVQTPGGVQVTAQGEGTSFVSIELPRDTSGIQHYKVVVVHVIGLSEAPTY